MFQVLGARSQTNLFTEPNYSPCNKKQPHRQVPQRFAREDKKEKREGRP
jgi:hypothetical protein